MWTQTGRGPPRRSGVFDASVEEVARIGNAFGTVTTNVAAPPGSELVLGAWTSAAARGFAISRCWPTRSPERFSTCWTTPFCSTSAPWRQSQTFRQMAPSTFSGASNEGFCRAQGSRTASARSVGSRIRMSSNLIRIWRRQRVHLFLQRRSLHRRSLQRVALCAHGDRDGPAFAEEFGPGLLQWSAQLRQRQRHPRCADHGWCVRRERRA